MDRLRRSTVIAYVEARPLPGNLSGRLTFAGHGQRWRYLRIETTDDTQRRFESDAAKEAGSRVQREWSLRLQTNASDLP